MLPHEDSQDSVMHNVDAHKTPWYFGIAIQNSGTKKAVGLITFYIAYSSWNGRILYVDRLDSNKDEKLDQSLLQMLAQVARRFDCARLTWRVSRHWRLYPPLLCH